MTKQCPSVIGKKSVMSFVLSKKQSNVLPPTETMLMLESALDSEKTMKKFRMKPKVSVVHVKRPPDNQAPKQHNPEMGLKMGSISDARTFDSSKRIFSKFKPPPKPSMDSRDRSTTLSCSKPPMVCSRQRLVPLPTGAASTQERILSVSTKVTSLTPQSIRERSELTKLSLKINSGSHKRHITSEFASKPFKRHQTEVISRAFESTNGKSLTRDNNDEYVKLVTTAVDQNVDPQREVDETDLSAETMTKEVMKACDSSSNENIDSRSNNFASTAVQVPTIQFLDIDDAASIKLLPPQKSMKQKTTENFVRLNMKNNGGSCRGSKRKSKWERKREEGTRKVKSNACIPRPSIHDPLDDYLDGAYREGTASKAEKGADKSNPLCGGHQKLCKVLIVKKAGPNKGRKFHVCSMPRGEQCDYFEWVDNSAAAAKEVLLKKSSFSGFVARQVSKYVERFQILTVPELREETRKRGLGQHGKKCELLMRLSLFIRDELAGVKNATNDGDEKKDTDVIDDDESTSSTELEIGDESDCDENADDPSGILNKVVDNDCGLQSGILDERQDRSDSTPNIHAHLRQLFGFSSFREGQEWAIQRCMSQNRSLLVAPTGFGKSLCYALPAAILEGTCIVISPLISLIDDQLRQLPPKIPAATLSGGMSASAMAITIDDVLKGRVKILFVSPERLTTPSFRRLFKPKWNKEALAMERQFPPVSLLCIDEAHCMSQWAHNFRPSYLRLRSLLECIEPRSVLAITATAGPPIIRDICRYLQIQSEPDSFSGVKVLKSDRDNIDVFCKFMESDEARLRLAQRLLMKHSHKVKSDSEQSIHDGCLAEDIVIVYVWRQRDADLVAEALSQSGVEGKIVVYHAGMDSKARAAAQSTFQRGKARICVATVAFGMGINKTDIDTVVHLNLPSSLEHYLQEIGRAGRDGRPAKAISLLTKDESALRHSLAHSDMISQSQVLALIRMLGDSIRIMRDDVECSDPNIKYARFFIGLPVNKTVSALDCKIETIETLLSLLEGDDILSSFLRFEGRANDLLSVVFKKSPLTQLEVREPVMRCIIKCGRRVERSGKAENVSNDVSVTSSLDYGNCNYEFSVSRCTNLMGPYAEPRHVYAALRRLQSQGEIEFASNAHGYALQLEICATSIIDLKDSCIRNLSFDLWKQFSNQILCTAGKVKRVEALLREVASTENSKTAVGCKSARLLKFQELTSKELSKSDDKVHSSEQRGEASTFSSKELMYDAQSILQYLSTSTTHRNANEPEQHCVRFDESDFEDYTSLTVAKFLHGIVTPSRTPQFAQHNTLFGKWRHLDFEVVRAQVYASLGGKEES